MGGEEDGSAGTEDMPDDKLYTTPEDMLAVYEALQGQGRYMFAATFGNVHGHYKPGAVKLRPDILKDGQEAVISNTAKKLSSISYFTVDLDHLLIKFVRPLVTVLLK